MTAAGGAVAVELDDGSSLETDVVVVGAGRRARVRDIGLETVGLEADGTHLPVDEHCRLGEGLWALGDAIGGMMFTHLAKYQARVIADNILGRERRADYRAIPRVVFSDPEMAAVGMTEEEARAQGFEAATARLSLPDVLARPWTYERAPHGEMGLVADGSGRSWSGPGRWRPWRESGSTWPCWRRGPRSRSAP